jgi:hypothetical protein
MLAQKSTTGVDNCCRLTTVPTGMRSKAVHCAVIARPPLMPPSGPGRTNPLLANRRMGPTHKEVDQQLRVCSEL